jgi:hypothetical protein
MVGVWVVGSGVLIPVSSWSDASLYSACSASTSEVEGATWTCEVGLHGAPGQLDDDNALAPSRCARARNGHLGAQRAREWTLRAGIAMCSLCLCAAARGRPPSPPPAFRAAR